MTETGEPGEPGGSLEQKTLTETVGTESHLYISFGF